MNLSKEIKVYVRTHLFLQVLRLKPSIALSVCAAGIRKRKICCTLKNVLNIVFVCVIIFI